MQKLRTTPKRSRSSFDPDSTQSLHDARQHTIPPAYNKVPFIDSATRSNQQVRRWVSPRTFIYTGGEEPYGDGVWQRRFFKIDGSTVNIDAG